VFIGIDAPDFNLGLERSLKQAGLPTVHYVSPSVWAWRERRAARIGRSADMVLCLFPIEPPFYHRHGIDARFVGHPLADVFPDHPDALAARVELGMPLQGPLQAVLPGSRLGEITRLLPTFLDAVERLAQAIPGLTAVIPAANEACRVEIRSQLAARSAANLVLLDGRAHQAMIASDVVLLASGTAALEAMLAKRPMVVGYRISGLTYRIVTGLGLMKIDRFSLPNVLANEPIVPELMQDECTAENLADALQHWFDDGRARATLQPRFLAIHARLRGNASALAAAAIAELLAKPR
jgi:lipid-A-disaccharide synthase